MSNNGKFFIIIPRWIGALVFASGLLMMASWYEHWQKVLQWIPDTAPMQFNTALCFVLLGIALFLLTTRQLKVAAGLGGLVAVFTMLTLLEYLTGQSFGIDLLFFDPFFEAATTFPGRMSPLAAVCFSLVGLSLISASTNRNWRHRLAIAGVLMCIVSVISLVALFGFLFGIQSAYGWGAYSSLAVNTSVMFLLLSVGVLACLWQAARQENYNFIRWLPVTASITLMFMVAIVAIGDVKGLQAATYWRRHTIQVILESQAFDNRLIDLQRGMRGYVTTGDTNSLAAFQSAASTEPAQFNELVNLTLDNPTQQDKLKELAAAMQALFAYDHHLMEVYRSQGPEAVFKIDSLPENRAYFGGVQTALRTFSGTEQKLLDQREGSETNSYRNTERLLVFACALSILLLLIANYMASYELAKRQKAELKLARQAEALRRSNTELEQFAYVASHDLREPLRAVTGFAQILKRQCQNRLDEQSNLTIERIVDGAKRMALIIDDLLALSSIGSQKAPFEKTGLEKPLAQALENLSVTISERKAVVRHDALPVLPVDSSQLALLFQNLIGNAIKFCTGRAPEIQVGARQETAGAWTISVRDNGIGIDPKYFDKIFGIFQRLHTREAYPGTGIGLAICKKIVERHGGRIWLESAVGNGTTFYFTLAEKPKEQL